MDRAQYYAAEADREARQDSNYHQYGGPLASLRAYRGYHPAEAIHWEQVGNRRIWMTGKQYRIWWIVRHDHNRGRHQTLSKIAKRARTSRATVSRFLRRMHGWGVVRVVSKVGRHGGVWLRSVQARYVRAEVARRAAEGGSTDATFTADNYYSEAERTVQGELAY